MSVPPGEAGRAELSREEKARLFERLRARKGLSAGTGAAGEAPILRREPRPEPLPLSFAQQRLWFLDRLHPGDPSYNVPAVLEIEGPLRPDALRRALESLTDRHEALRTTFREVNERPAQIVAPRLAVPLPLVDLTALPETGRGVELERIVRDEVLRPFDLAAGPLLRALLLRQAAQSQIVLLNLHHVVCDGWSLGVLVREVAALYSAGAAAVAGAPPALPPLPIQYADFAVWQRDWLQGERLANQLAFWRGALAGVEPLRLPTDRPRPSRRGSAGGTRPVAVGPAMARRLQALALAERATPFIVLLAAWQALLGRLAGQDDVAVGSPVANRTRSETAGLIGFFVNTLVLRGSLSGDPAFRELVVRSRAVALAAFAHQDLPFERLVEELRLERDASRTPVFQALLVLQNAPSSTLAAGGLEIRDRAFPTATAKFDLSLAFTEVGEGFQGVLEFSAELFDGATAVRFARAFETLLAAGLTRPELRLSDLPLLAAGERQQLVVEWNPAGEGLSVRQPIHRLFESQVDRAPDALAITSGGETLTYGELDSRANRLAHHLLASGVRPGELVALRLERSAEMVVAILAVLKAGAGYLPLDPAYPSERLAFALEDSGAALLLTQEMLDAEAEAIAARGPERLDVPADPELPAYVIYTSGSTGRPKGVVIPHGHVTRLFSATQDWFHFGPDDVWTLFHSYAFDFSVWEIWGALLHGGRLVVVPHWQARSPKAFYALLRDERVTVLNQTPSAFRQLLWAEEAVLDGDSPDLALRPLRLVIFGGEALEPAALAPWFERHGDEHPRLVNMYGITETTVHVTYRPVRRGDVAGGSLLGVPIPDLTLHVVDRGLVTQPIGVPGEIAVGGQGVARGYLGRPELAAERFVPDPYGAPGARLYRSGDLARRLPDGDIEYLGRIDTQVKIRGYRVELGEIEAALAAQAGVREAVVLVREDAPGDRRLVAYLAAAAGEAADPAALRRALGRRLPDYMIPAAFVFLDALPLTANGKLDRRALPAPETAAPSALERRAPRDSLERFLATQFREVLGLPADREIGIDEDFFTLGGTSITSAIFIHRLQEALGETVHVVAIFDHPTVAALADYVRELHPGASWKESGTAARTHTLDRDVLVPLQAGSPGRRPFFFVHSVGGEVVAYRELVRRLGPDQPAWGLQSPDPPLESIPEMAERYVAAVRSVQPAGPYRIAGWSMGAAAAYEMARQLEAQGETTEVLALIDAVSPVLSAGELGLDDVEMLGLFALALADLHDVEIEGLDLPPRLRLATLGLDQVDLSGLDLDSALDMTLDLGRQAALLPPNLERDEFRRLLERFRANRSALSAYHPLPYGGELHLFRAIDQAKGELDPTLGWNDLAPGRVRVFDSPGDHYTILREEVEALASQLRRLLAADSLLAGIVGEEGE